MKTEKNTKEAFVSLKYIQKKQKVSKRKSANQETRE